MVPLFIFVFISIILGDRLKKILLQFMSETIWPMLSSKKKVSDLTFRSLIYFEVIFMYDVLEGQRRGDIPILQGQPSCHLL